MPPQNFDWQEFLRTYAEELRNAPPNFQYRADKSAQDSAYFEYKNSYDDKARLPFDYEGEVLDINETEWCPAYRWFNNRPHDKFAYQYKPFDQWFTLFEITSEVLYQGRRGKISLIAVGIQLKDQLDEKRYYKVERLY